MCTRTFFKETDRNSYIPTSSCHHQRPVYSTPNTRLRRNCHADSDFFEQAEKLIERFLDKGYTYTFFMEERDRIWQKKELNCCSHTKRNLREIIVTLLLILMSNLTK